MFIACLCLASLALLMSGFGDVSIFVTAQTAIVILAVAGYLLKYLFDKMQENSRLKLRGELLFSLLFSVCVLPAAAGLILVLFKMTGLVFSAVTILLVFFIGYSVFMSRLGQMDFSESGFDLNRYGVLAMTVVVTIIIIGFLLISLMMVNNGFI